MKKLLLAALAILSLTFSSCKQDDIEMMETVALAGDWVITYSNSGNEYEVTHALTFNTSANLPTEIWVSDNGGFWDFQVKCACDINALTFQTDGFVQNVAYDSKVKITNGKVVKNGCTLPSGRVVDAISYDVEFDDDEAPGIIWHAEGRRYTGFAEDN